ncbi:hypothetical protein V496_02428 [Pseudogymnoascus sp. VKM F-4515 (FW-2607)]|nr:hypothetical protein V496_02428 [Pseudogymnoascus sp. VKM F-4515 (FW-2607)]
MCCLPWPTSAILLGLVLWSKVDAKLQASRLCLLLLNNGLIICYEATILYNLLSGRFFGAKLGILRAALGWMGIFVSIICICAAVLPHQLSAVLKANMVEAMIAYAILMSGYGFHVRGPQPIRLTMGVTAVFCLVMGIIAGAFLVRRVVDSVQGGLVTCTWIFLGLSSLFSIDGARAFYTNRENATWERRLKAAVRLLPTAMLGNYWKQLWRAICGRVDGTEFYKVWNSSGESVVDTSPSPSSSPPPPPPPRTLPQLPFVRACGPPTRYATIASIAPKPNVTALIYLHSDVILEAKLNFSAVSGEYDAGWIYLDAVNRLHEIQQTKSKSDVVLQGTCIEPPTATLENIIRASSESVKLARDASDQLDTNQGVISRCRYDAILLHGRRVRYVIEGGKSYEGQLCFDLRYFTIQGVGKKRLSFLFNDANFASGESRFEPLEEEIGKGSVAFSSIRDKMPLTWDCTSCRKRFSTYDGIYDHFDYILQQEQQGRLRAEECHKPNINIIKDQSDAHQKLAQRDWPHRIKPPSRCLFSISGYN